MLLLLELSRGQHGLVGRDVEILSDHLREGGEDNSLVETLSGICGRGPALVYGGISCPLYCSVVVDCHPSHKHPSIPVSTLIPFLCSRL